MLVLRVMVVWFIVVVVVDFMVVLGVVCDVEESVVRIDALVVWGEITEVGMVVDCTFVTGGSLVDCC